MSNWEEDVHAALKRIKRAVNRGTGCHLTADMVSALSVTSIATSWNELDELSEEEQ